MLLLVLHVTSNFPVLQNLFTDEKAVATFKGIPFMTSAGPCTSSIPKASIK